MIEKRETQSSLTMHVAEFAAASHVLNLPDDVIELGRKSILDGLGLAIAGSACESGHIVNEYVRDFGGNHATCRVLGTNLRVSTIGASCAPLGTRTMVLSFTPSRIGIMTSRLR